ncbi:hypothetical protein E4U41_006604 [Claviceps citrina]|nr:hypothetical protein E4U41_006604 [Claviceps citrina]
MKFSTVLGSLAVSAFEASLAHAGPVPDAEGTSVPIIDARNTEYCCVSFKNSRNEDYQYVAWNGEETSTFKFYNCDIRVDFTSTPPSRGGCGQWVFWLMPSCDYLTPQPHIAVAPASSCGRG